MELGLSLGDASKPFNFLTENNTQKETQLQTTKIRNNSLDFCIALGLNQELQKTHKSHDEETNGGHGSDDIHNNTTLQLNLLPLSPVLSPVPLQIYSNHQSLSYNGSSDNGSSENMGSNKREFEAMRNDVVEADSRGSDEEENGLNTRKKLRLSKEQSAFLEESFKEQSTLNPKQKIALAKQLNLRARQVEVWFQNRRARTKLKQTEVDCEYLKRCCETLTEDNRRLHKELQELRVLKTSSSNPFYMQLPATTLTMCPSCERTASSSAAVPQPVAAFDSSSPQKEGIPFPLTRPRLFFPFSHHPNQPASS
ncbi:hypothetical protein ACJIZ3_007633 [Penstemon smallii]|uniref:Homeobox domain-containing protein n=1 Tax=Penstemon smallii TaxID=265156 RepID=A0ABD3T975_9LAMI